ncbi:Acetyltransferase (GNAT) family protein [Paenibacillus algorifonticola]|uniref:Acetyltransferase (GNAT) family protein n=1 Tax=Paenibacillus algorifonticola TaxID=684063 RepID=A0A1I2I8D6_9BACL|nr:GNAT family N-acetyltransferase [Paenibacillus algorifonticola]SFF37913.1 Acetyltransferase (GNAT) family protein [Paenibacillus algorifonticola]
MIVPAKKEDVQQIMLLLHAAIGNIACTLTGVSDEQEAMNILADFYVKKGNRLSYEHVLVAWEGDVIAGMALGYGGDAAAKLDAPLLSRIHQEPAHAGYEIMTEARNDEYYLDSVAVHPAYQGKGIARALIGAVENKAKEAGWPRLSLIALDDNEKATALYARMGYAEDGELELAGHRYIRMVKQLTQ